MPLTRHQQRLVDQRQLLDQNASQPIHRLIPELLSEIFLQARPNIFTGPMRERSVWVKFVRYLLNITSVSCYFRQIALDFGGLWTVVGFSVRHSGDNHCRSALLAMEAFLERAQKRKALHFYFNSPSFSPPPEWFYPNLLALIGPHAGRVQTFYFRRNDRGDTIWEHLQILLTRVANVKNLTVSFPGWMATEPSPHEPISLPHLRELSLTHAAYGGSFLESTKQVESLELRFCNHDLHIQHWRWKLPKLKRLVLCGRPHPSLSITSSLLLEDLVHLETNSGMYPIIAPWLSLLQHRHLVVDMDSSFPPLEPQLYCHPSVRTLSIILTAPTLLRLKSAALFVTMNPQLEYLEFVWMAHGLSELLSEVLKSTRRRRHTRPGEVPNFPGPSLKYLRLWAIEGPGKAEETLLSKQLRVILSGAPELRLDLVRPAQEPTLLRKLVERFPSQVRSHLEPYQGTPLHELYDDLPRSSESK